MEIPALQPLEAPEGALEGPSPEAGAGRGRAMCRGGCFSWQVRWWGGGASASGGPLEAP